MAPQPSLYILSLVSYGEISLVYKWPLFRLCVLCSFGKQVTAGQVLTVPGALASCAGAAPCREVRCCPDALLFLLVPFVPRQKAPAM